MVIRVSKEELIILVKIRKKEENITVRRIGRKAKGLETAEEKEHRKAISFLQSNQVRVGFD